MPPGDSWPHSCSPRRSGTESAARWAGPRPRRSASRQGSPPQSPPRRSRPPPAVRRVLACYVPLLRRPRSWSQPPWPPPAPAPAPARAAGGPRRSGRRPPSARGRAGGRARRRAAGRRGMPAGRTFPGNPGWHGCTRSRLQGGRGRVRWIGFACLPGMCTHPHKEQQLCPFIRSLHVPSSCTNTNKCITPQAHSPSLRRGP